MQTRAPLLTDDVVILRAHSEDDVPAIIEQCVDPESRRWTTVPSPYTREDAKRFVREAMPGGWASDQEWAFAVEYDGRFAGTVSLRNRGPQLAEIAYGAHPAARGSDAFERALRLLLSWGFEHQPIRTVLWLANRGNWASRRLAWKVGFSFDGTVRGLLDHRGVPTDAWTGTLLAGEPMEPRVPWLETPGIVGDRVVLRRHHDKDVDRVEEAGRDPESQRWLRALPSPYTRADAEEFLATRSMDMAAGTGAHWMIADPVDDELLGTVSLMNLPEGEAEVGYWLHPQARGRGVMSEALGLLARHAFIDAESGGLGLRRLYAYAASENTASRRVLETAGFTEFGTSHQRPVVRDGLCEVAHYELLRADFSPSAPAAAAS